MLPFSQKIQESKKFLAFIVFSLKLKKNCPYPVFTVLFYNIK